MSAIRSRKSLGELMIVISILAILMSVFIHYFFKQAPNYNKTSFQGVKSAFASKVHIVRSKWLMDNRPRWVKMGKGDNAINVPVNRKGWVDSENADLNCEKIWQLVMDMPLFLLKSPIIAIEIKEKSAPKSRTCRYSITSGEMFEYNTKNGNVTNINN